MYSKVEQLSPNLIHPLDKYNFRNLIQPVHRLYLRHISMPAAAWKLNIKENKAKHLFMKWLKVKVRTQ